MSPKSFFEEKVSRKHRQNVLRAAKEELRQRKSVWRQPWSLALVTAGLGALSWISFRSLPKEEFELESNEALALAATDPELLENMDWLDDLDIIENLEELEEWNNS